MHRLGCIFKTSKANVSVEESYHPIQKVYKERKNLRKRASIYVVNIYIYNIYVCRERERENNIIYGL